MIDNVDTILLNLLAERKEGGEDHLEVLETEGNSDNCDAEEKAAEDQPEEVSECIHICRFNYTSNITIIRRFVYICKEQ